MAVPEGAGFLDDHLPTLLARAAQVTAVAFDRTLRHRGVGAAEWRVLAALRGGAEAAVSGLATRCLLQQPTATKLVHRMQRAGLVRRVADPRDRRVVRVALTPRGETLADELVGLATTAEAEVLTDPEAAAIKAALRRLLQVGKPLAAVARVVPGR